MRRDINYNNYIRDFAFVLSETFESLRSVSLRSDQEISCWIVLVPFGSYSRNYTKLWQNYQQLMEMLGIRFDQDI